VGLTTVCEDIQGILQIGREIQAKLTFYYGTRGFARESTVLSTDSAIPTLKGIHIFEKIFEIPQIVMFGNYLN
jgi:hypothetical protein